MMLMGKNTPVYDIEKEKTLNYNLLPGQTITPSQNG